MKKKKKKVRECPRDLVWSVFSGFEGLGFEVWGLGFGVRGLGFGGMMRLDHRCVIVIRVSGFVIRVSGFGICDKVFYLG